MQECVYKSHFLQNGHICCERPFQYLSQIPQNTWSCNTNNCISASSVLLQKNYVDYWSRNIPPENSKRCCEELRQEFKKMLDMASKSTENTNPQLLLCIDVVSYIMADDFA